MRALLVPSRGFRTPTRLSRFLFDWVADDGVLTARTGQVLTLARAGLGTALDSNGRLRTLVHSQPRYQALDLDNDAVRETVSLLTEPSAINRALWNRDLTNAAWVSGGGGVTKTKDQTGLDGVANSASKLVAAGANATCLQAITLASSTRMQTAYVKRVTGAGTIHMTTDGGATWTVITVTSAWTRVSVPAQVVTNPSIGFRIVTSGDAIAIDCVQNETGAVATSPIATTTVAVTRVAETLSTPFLALPQAMTFYADFVERGNPVLANFNRICQVSDAAGNGPTINLFADPSGYYRFSHTNATTTVNATMGTAPVAGNRVRLRGVLYSDGSCELFQSIDGAAETTSGRTAANALASAWVAAILWIGSLNGGSGAVLDLAVLRIAAGEVSLATLQAA